MSRIMWRLGLGFLVVAGWAVAGEPPPFRETARVTLHQWMSQDGQGKHPFERAGKRRDWASDELGDGVEMAATQHVWISQTGIWSSTASWKTSQIPGAGGANLDTAIFDGTSNVSVIGETPGGNALYRIVSKPAYKGDIGSPSNPLVVQVASEALLGAHCVFRGRGNVYYKPLGGTQANIIVDTGTRDRVVYLDNSPLHVVVKSGKVEFGDNVSAVVSLTVLETNSHVTIPTAGISAGNTVLRLLAGVVDSRKDGATSFATINMTGGHLIESGYLADATDVNMYGGWFEYVTTTAISTHNPDLWLLGGTFDLSRLNEDLVAADLVIGPSAIVLGNVRGQGQVEATDLEMDLTQDYP